MSSSNGSTSSSEHYVHEVNSDGEYLDDEWKPEEVWESALIEIAEKRDASQEEMDAIFGREDYARDAAKIGREYWKSRSAPFHVAAEFGRENMMRMLVGAGVNVNSFRRKYEESERGISESSHTALHQAVYCHSVGTVKLLLALGADPTVKSTASSMEGSSFDVAREYGKYYITYNSIQKRGYEILQMLKYPRNPRSLVDKIKSRGATEKELDKSIKIQEKLRLLKDKQDRDKININMMCMKLREEKESEPKFHEANKLYHDERDEVWKEMSALKALPNYMDEGEIAWMQDELKKLSALSEDLDKIVSPVLSPFQACPDCAKSPEEGIFGCQNCDFWVCGLCKDRRDKCQKCGQNLRAKPLVRNWIGEGLISRLSF